MYSLKDQDFYQTGGLTEEDRWVYKRGLDFLKRNNEGALNEIGFTLMRNIDGGTRYGIFHHGEGFTLVIEIHPGSKTFKLEVAGKNAEGRKKVAKTLMDIIGLELRNEEILLSKNKT